MNGWEEVSPGAYLYHPPRPLSADNDLVFIDEVRHRRLREIRASLSKELDGMPNSEELRPYFEMPHHAGIVGLPTSADREIADYLSNGPVFPSWLRKDRPLHVAETVNQAAMPPSPPIDISEFLSILLSGSNRESFVGDLEERYGVIFAKKGYRAATTWFWRQVAHSFFSLAFGALKRLSGLEKLIERYRRIGS